MAESTLLSQEEMDRRESYLRAYNRPKHLLDPLTWSYSAKSSLAATGGAISMMYIYNLWGKKPWYYAGYVRGIGLFVTALAGYGFGALRMYNYKTRDAVIDHYMEIHPNDFDRVKDFYGRPFSEILMPWIPFRTQFWDFSFEKENTS